MKKLIIPLLFFSLTATAQLSKVSVGTTAGDGTGDPLRTAFQKLNLGIDTINAHSVQIPLKAPKANPTFTGVAVLNSMRVGGLGKVLIDSISSDGSNIRFWRGVTELTAVPGVGGAAWGSLTGTLTDQTDLKNALDAKAPLNSPAFTGTPTGITAAHVGAMSTSHAANVITGTNISNWNTAYGWGNHSTAGYALSSALSGYVPTSRTVNGYALSSNVTISASDIGLGNVTNESKATMFTSPTFTGTPTVPGYVPTTRTVNGHFLSSNVSVTASDVGLGNVTNESKATMFTSPTFTGTPLAPTAGAGTNTTQIATTAFVTTAAAAKLSISDTSAMLSTYIDNTGLNDMSADLGDYAFLRTDTVSIREVAFILTDTIPQMVFGAGDGVRGSQPAFLPNKLLGAVWYGGSDTLFLTEVRGVVVQDSGTVTSGVQLYYDANAFDGTPTTVMSGTMTINSTTAGNIFTQSSGTSISNEAIPPERWIWAKVLTKSNGNMPVFMSLTLSGYKKRSY